MRIRLAITTTGIRIRPAERSRGLSIYALAHSDQTHNLWPIFRRLTHSPIEADTPAKRKLFWTDLYTAKRKRVDSDASKCSSAVSTIERQQHQECVLQQIMSPVSWLDKTRTRNGSSIKPNYLLLHSFQNPSRVTTQWN